MQCIKVLNASCYLNTDAPVTSYNITTIDLKPYNAFCDTSKMYGIIICDVINEPHPQKANSCSIFRGVDRKPYVQVAYRKCSLLGVTQNYRAFFWVSLIQVVAILKTKAIILYFIQ